MFLTGFQSVLSGKQFKVGEREYIAEEEGPKGLLNSTYDFEALKKSLPGSLLSPTLGMFRYMPFLPIDPKDQLPNVQVGGTPLIPVPQDRSPFKIQLWIKDEGREPTASLKDRASALVCVKAKELGKTVVTTASSGNAAAATSCMCACLGLKPVIFVPAHAPPAKVLQNRLYGATVFLVEGVYDRAVEAAMGAAKKYGWYNRSTGFNPYTIDGKKTVSFEICEQLGGILCPEETKGECSWGKLGKFVAPDAIVVSVGDGNIISGVHKGLKELFAAGLIEKVPKIIGVQAEGSNSVYVCWSQKIDPVNMPVCEGSTLADSISCPTPNDPIRAFRAATETNGAYVQVTDEEILAAIPTMARATGIFPEPAAAAGFAGIFKAEQQGYLKPGEKVVMISTGNGLKDINNATKSMEGKNVATLIKTYEDIDGSKI